MSQLALELDDEWAGGHVGLAEACRQAGMIERVLEHCRRALAMDPASVRARGLLAEVGGTSETRRPSRESPTPGV